MTMPTQAETRLQVIARVERTAINAFMQLALKLNEATFRPLFLRLHDWAAIEAGSKQLRNDRLTILFRIMDRLLSQLKVINSRSLTING